MCDFRTMNCQLCRKNNCGFPTDSSYCSEIKENFIVEHKIDINQWYLNFIYNGLHSFFIPPYGFNFLLREVLYITKLIKEEFPYEKFPKLPLVLTPKFTMLKKRFILLNIQVLSSIRSHNYQLKMYLNFIDPLFLQIREIKTKLDVLLRGDSQTREL